MSLTLTDTIDLTRADVEDFLFHEAALIDAWDLDAWIELFTQDARYQIPCNDDPAGDGDRSLMLIDDNRLRLGSRVERLKSRKAHREYPHSNVRHFVSNVRILKAEPDGLQVTCSLLVGRFRANKETYYCGQADYTLLVDEGALLIRHKRVTLDMTTLRHASDVAIIL